MFFLYRKISISLLLLLISQLAWSQKFNKDYVLKIGKTSEEIVLDGQLNESIWETADLAKNFSMILPQDDRKATQFSEVRMAYDDKNIYLAVIFFNNTVKGDYVVESYKRDFSFGKNDNFLVAIDPFNNMTTGFAFGLNAYGAQWDGTMYDGRSVDLNWDTKWYSEVAFDEEKWTAEIAIPFKSIRYNDDLNQWGISFSRLDLKASEKSGWTPVPRQFPSITMAYSGILEWDNPPPSQGSNISFIPYLSGEIDSPQKGTTNQDLNAGADVKFNLTSSLNLDITLNPDFSQAEVDQQVTNLDRFELFFPERRQFFLENADLFANFGYENIRPFFSRRIGLNNPILGGIRLSGNIDEKWRVGLLDIQTQAEEEKGLPAENFGVFSLQRKVLDRSSIGMIFVNKQSLGDLEDTKTTSEEYNRNLGLEYNYFSADNLWNGKLMYLKSFSPGSTDDDAIFAGNLTYNDNNFLGRVQTEYVGENYNAEVGYVPRTHYYKFDTSLRYLFFPSQDSKILSHGPLFGSIQYFNFDGVGIDRGTQLGYEVNFKNRSEMVLTFENQFIVLQNPFDPIRTGIQSLGALTEHRWNSINLAYDSKPQSLFTYALESSYGGYFQDGKRWLFFSEMGYRFQPYVELNALVSYNHIELEEPWGTNGFWLLGVKSNFTFTRNIFFSNLYQYNEQQKLWNFNSRFQWRYKPASDIFLVFNSSDTRMLTPNRNWNLTLKINYWINL
ncbi:carbohydrate binding family 9 domain-containing protein [Flavobacteriaceae bacterium]|nr:carbohydrate binding family 9 domain-containing protein [Flavobacteriaceae bacterium]MDA8763675.1 carbohydrate binding family 9 domain-containing protein [Flavobacteriaceae bacterium]